ncbi:hypothetical protein ColTof4_11805 [Colletotrichum tofieldiae]|nr:hypothetical protein ColTof3_03120 [Colletotrichum tofieldiae]GKT79382.1 hypothetical protein ColTof4_11805 [Colletotrichum tofieldiae]GKT82554.1 hypothetical protein Ct61P_00404 [Colletotrichum tofieldiae]
MPEVLGRQLHNDVGLWQVAEKVRPGNATRRRDEDTATALHEGSCVCPIHANGAARRDREANLNSEVSEWSR